MSSIEFKQAKTLIIKLKKGDDVLNALTDKLKKVGISDGIILTGIGSATSYHIHVVDSESFPVKNIFFKGRGPFDIVNMQGHIMEGRVHAHISLSDNKNANQIGGHLEEGCKVLTFCIITLMQTNPLGQLDKYL